MLETLQSSGDASELFGMLVMPLLDAAYGWALHATRNRADAEDVVQDAVIKALRSFNTFKQGTNFKAWFFKVLMTCFYTRYRRAQASRETTSLEEAPDLYIFTKARAANHDLDAADPARVAMARIETEQITVALQELPEEFRDVATLYFLDDFTYQELADMLNIPVGTVRSRLHRARRLLQKRLWQLAYE